MDESSLYSFWEKERLFAANPDSDKKPYSLLMPPPNLTGELHLGQAMQHTILDAIARFKRMQGFDVLLLPGVDHAGIQFEGTLNKMLSKEGLTKAKLGREEWLKRAWQFKEEVYQSFHKTWTAFGLSADWSREVFTMEPKIQKAVFFEFKKFWEEKLLYKGAYIIQWCPKCGTAIEDIEMEYQERKEKLYFVKYEVHEAPYIEECIVVATARPETIFADSGIAIYPNHPKFNKYAGLHAVNPLTEQVLLIFTDVRVDKEFGTGALKVTPGHDPLDYEIGKEHSLPVRHAINKTGRMTELAGDLVGLKIEEARQKAVEKLESLGAIEKTEDYTHSVPVCERCKTTVEPLISEEWFVKMDTLAKKALENMDEINFLPKSYKKILSDWLKKIHDWSISRSLWWGHRIPVWYCQKCNPNRLVDRGQGMVVSLEAPGQECPVCGENDWIQDEQVLDTWFSSGLWPMSTLGWPNETKELKRYFPWDFEITAPEIKYLWITRMIVLSLHFKNNIPFKNMFFHGMLRPLSGPKFSKSLGNGIDPLELINLWGTDATRMALYAYSIPGRDGRTSRQLMDERCKNFRNFGTKLRNIYRFIMELKPTEIAASPSTALRIPRNDNEEDGAIPTNSFPVIASGAKQSQNSDDKKILEGLNKTVVEVTKNLENFQLHLATENLYEFIWHQFADVYIEKSKERRAEAQPVLEYVFKTSLEILHPFMPYITEDLWQRLPHRGKPVLSKVEGSIMVAKWPEVSRG